jgi:hypothetical protein
MDVINAEQVRYSEYPIHPPYLPRNAHSSSVSIFVTSEIARSSDPVLDIRLASPKKRGLAR